jgi:uncharacterized protein YbjT (DUF2867 family)
MRVLVIGGTGTVGSIVVRDLLANRAEVQVLTRDSSKVSALPSGAKAALGDLRNPNSARPHFEGIDSVFMLNGAGTSETYEGVMGVLLARLAKVKSFVYMSAHRVEMTKHLPIGGATKLPIEEAVKVSGIPYTILRPNNFFQNDLWYKTSILERGVYPQPIGFKGMQRVDARDISAAALIALTRPGHEGKTYNIVGPQLETGPSTAQAWAEALNRTVVYAGNDLDAFERAHSFMGSELLFPYRQFYEFYQEHGMFAESADIQQLTVLLGRPPHALRDFAKETAATWGRVS